MTATRSHIDFRLLAEEIKCWSRELGFQRLGICGTDLSLAEQRLDHWLEQGRQGEMGFMARHGRKRSRPAELVPGTLRILSVRMDYPSGGEQARGTLADPVRAYVARYALGRDYHKLMRSRLQRLAHRIERRIGPFGYRAFVDSAPVLEKPLAQNAGLGWSGKHSNLVSREAGCWFFLGELYVDIPLPVDPPERDHCGRCQECIDACPTRAIIEPYQVDARRCISYLTIEHPGAIPYDLRPLIGNRIFGCDDCLLACPWNRFASPSLEPDFLPRQGLDQATLLELFNWDESDFLKRMEGSPIRRIGHQRWLRNLALALGNAVPNPEVIAALHRHAEHPSAVVREHVDWALQRQQTEDR